MTLKWLGAALVVVPLLLVAYSYVGYPVLLRLIGWLRARRAPTAAAEEWPTISIAVPVYNEEAQIAALIESLLRLDYPADRCQILIVSDGSDDRTDEIVRGYSGRGVEFHRMPRRGGKTAAENATAPLLRGEIVVNTDASIRIDPPALKRLISCFSDPTIGVSSGRDVSVERNGTSANVGEAQYVGYEMAVRALETRVAGIVGASGCFYAIRSDLHRKPLPDWLSRDFAAAMIARQHGYRSVSVDDALCFVPRTSSLSREYRRKVRTMTRGMETIFYLRELLNPFRYGWFSWMLFSHKICRWLVPWTGILFVIGLMLLQPTVAWARWVLMATGGLLGIAGAGWWWALNSQVRLPRFFAIPAYALAGNIAALHAGIDALSGDRNATWEPTRRDALPETQAEGG